MWFSASASNINLQPPGVILTWNTWDDYGYKTTFNARLWLSASESLDLGTIKILRIDQLSGPTPMPEQPVKELGSDYCSLGGGINYYETLFKLGPALYEPYLRGISDAAYSHYTRAKFEDLEGYRVSLLRFSGAERTIADASLLFANSTPIIRDRDEGLCFAFRTSLAPTSNSIVIEFDFKRRGPLFHRMNVLIGYNGTGKTCLLSNLAVVASGYGYADKEAALEKRLGSFVGQPPPFKTIIVISYSAFDTFVIPGRTAIEKERLQQDGALFGYVYCGLRERASIPHAEDGQAEGVYRLRTPEETEAEFVTAVRRARDAGRSQALAEALRPLLQDASFQRIGFASLYALASTDNDTALVQLFRNLSSGHKVVLKIIVEMIGYIGNSEATLVLIDEPETHLHPPLLAAFLRSVRTCLERFDAYAIVATHSPVVLQETPSNYVRLLRRVGNQSRVDRSTIETFGENIGVITSDVFNLDDSSTDWHSTLQSLTQTLDADEIEALFQHRLGFGPKSYVASLRSEQEEA